MTPYDRPLKNIKDISGFFKTNKDGSKTFIGKTLEIRIPDKFKKHGALVVGDTVTTLGIFDMIFDNEYHAGLNLLGAITIIPSDMGKFNYNNVDYTVLYLNEGDTFMTSTKILQNPKSVYVVWDEFVTKGGLPYWFNYESTLAIFQYARMLTGSGIGVSRSVLEGIITHLARDNRNIQKRYRLTDMTRPMRFLALNSISQVTDNTTSKIIGNYFKSDGLTSALRYSTENTQPFEDLLRGLVRPPMVEDATDGIG